MNKYHQQVKLLVKVLTLLDSEPCFALKGGTAINLFVENLPRLSVDIDLVYLPNDNRNDALAKIRDALDRLAKKISTHIPEINGVRVSDFVINSKIVGDPRSESRMTASFDSIKIKHK
ncbi:MAG: nucleotidyl transferase AbiEii/AbiGii toxin family protein [Alcanivoracaceae bacterium]|nr:nucleotidyl transferase AbiEii/AbiGii toxin family protein [Alcanivoracaceae bacterium]